MLGLNEQDTKRLFELSLEYNKRKSAILEIIEATGISMTNKNNEGEYIAEFGSSMPFRFLDPSQVTMYDGDGKEMMCACGKPATAGIMGKDAYVARCSDCFNGVLVRDV